MLKTKYQIWGWTSDPDHPVSVPTLLLTFVNREDAVEALQIPRTRVQKGQTTFSYEWEPIQYALSTPNLWLQTVEVWEEIK
jgi:hypothetical protein